MPACFGGIFRINKCFKALLGATHNLFFANELTCERSSGFFSGVIDSRLSPRRQEGPRPPPASGRPLPTLTLTPHPPETRHTSPAALIMKIQTNSCDAKNTRACAHTHIPPHFSQKHTRTHLKKTPPPLLLPQLLCL